MEVYIHTTFQDDIRKCVHVCVGDMNEKVFGASNLSHNYLFLTPSRDKKNHHTTLPIRPKNMIAFCLKEL